MLKNNEFSTSIFEGFARRFWSIFDTFFDAKTMDDSKNTFLAKPSKIVIFPRENDDFQEIGLKKKRKSAKKSMKNRMSFKSAIWEAFWKGFGRALEGQN